MRTLLVGGTYLARDLGEELSMRGWQITSIVDADLSPRLYPLATEVLPGGLGGPAELVAWARDHGVELIVDASHPFEEDLSVDAAEVALSTGVPLFMLSPASFESPATVLPTLHAAAAEAARKYHHVLVDVGPKVGEFAADEHNMYVFRLVEGLEFDGALPPRHQVMREQIHNIAGDYLRRSTELKRSVESEKQLIRDYQIDGIVLREDGSPDGAITLAAAEELRIPVILVARPKRRWLTSVARHHASSVEEALGQIYRWSSQQ